MAKRRRRTFTQEFEAQTVRLVRDSGKSLGVLAWELDLGESILRRWVRQAEIDGGRGPAGRAHDGRAGRADAAAA